MKLFFLPASPFSRKVRVLALEKGIDLPLCPVINLEDAAFLEANPLGQVPALLLENGQVLIESMVLCEYLDTLPSDRPTLIPHGAERSVILTHNALADGVITAAQKIAYERKRAPELQSADEISKQMRKIIRTLDVLEKAVPLVCKEPLSLFHITLGCALGYLDLRIAELSWRDICPSLKEWYAEFSVRPSMSTTAPDAAFLTKPDESVVAPRPFLFLSALPTAASAEEYVP